MRRTPEQRLVDAEVKARAIFERTIVSASTNGSYTWQDVERLLERLDDVEKCAKALKEQVKNG